MSARVFAKDDSRWVRKPTVSDDEQAKSWKVSFELANASDVEVAIIDRRTRRIVRHLAAGILGEKTPPPLAPNSLRQSIDWNGRDDAGRLVSNPDQLALRVRAGMKLALEQIVGGDPHAFYSEAMSDSDHSPWAICGLEAKPDGRVYVLGHSSNLGTGALRQYDVDGNYLRTLFPPPAGKQVEDMQGWGLHVRSDGSYVPIFNKVSDPSLSTTCLDVGHLQVARMFPTPEAERLSFWSTSREHGLFQRMEIRTEGTIAGDVKERLPGPLVTKPPFPSGSITPGSHIVHAMRGPVFSAFAPGGKSFYLSGLFAAQTRYGSILEIGTEGLWRDGQVWKVDRETGTTRVFFSLNAQSIPTDRRARAAAYGGTQSYAALHGVAVAP